MNEEMNVAQPIAPVLRNMKVGETVSYPLSRYISVLGTRERLHIMGVGIFKMNTKHGCVQVKRTK